MDEMNLKSLGELPEVSEVTEQDFIMAVVNGAGKRLPAGNFSGGGTDAQIDITFSDDLSSMSAVLSQGSFADLYAKIIADKPVNVLFKLASSTMSGYHTGCSYIYDSGALMGSEVIGFILMPFVVPASSFIPLGLYILPDGTVTAMAMEG